MDWLGWLEAAGAGTSCRSRRRFARLPCAPSPRASSPGPGRAPRSQRPLDERLPARVPCGAAHGEPLADRPGGGCGWRRVPGAMQCRTDRRRVGIALERVRPRLPTGISTSLETPMHASESYIVAPRGVKTQTSSPRCHSSSRAKDLACHELWQLDFGQPLAHEIRWTGGRPRGDRIGELRGGGSQR